MKKHNLPLFLFLLIHLAAFAAFGISAACGRFFITSDLFSMIPNTASSEALEIADKKLTGNSGKSVFILSQSSDFTTAKKNAEVAYRALIEEPAFPDFFESLTLYPDSEGYAAVLDFLQAYRWNLLSPETAAQLQTEEGRADFAEETLTNIFGGFSLASLDNLEEDPFFLDEINLRTFLQLLQDSGTNMSLRDGVLACEWEGQCFVMIQGLLTDKGAALAQKNNGVQLIYDVCLPLEDAASDGSSPARFVFSGTPFHSHKSSTNASREITLISLVSLFAVLAMLIFTFRNPLPIAAAFTSILLSIAFAFSVTSAVFGHIHALTLVFGTSLIGSCIDYSLHFFVNWKANRDLASGQEIKNFLKKGLTLSLASTELCYFLLIFAPFPLLRQMALFSFTGILSSFLTVLWVYPIFRIQDDEKRFIPSFKPALCPALPRKVFLVILILPAALIALNLKNLAIKNNLSNLYKMQGRLKSDTILASQVLNYTPSSWFILEAGSEEELLQKEEAFSALYQIKTASEGNFNKKYICTSRLIPSEKSQRLSIEACRTLTASQECLSQFEILDFEKPEVRQKEILKKIDDADFLSLESPLPPQLESLVKMLWLGKIDGRFYSVFMPTENLPTATLESLAAPEDGIFYQNKVSQISAGLDRLSKMILLMLTIAYIIILIVLRLFFNVRQTLKIALVPLFSLISILAVFTASGTPIDFFCITGIILVFGLGIDYIIYMTQHKGGRLERTAIILSFLTTAISFGALALSSFVPVHSIGLAIFTGLTAAFIATMM
ncbi:MMPL family transporter [Treponema sp. C6A8]|uniref:MMPL family transporter n=1 Tax=Treponema sp. C6A8 TaxID=1410609 RepID=UPI000481A659|nr:hypothetical protein [Treponema sp. C6A8]